jgi:hypothetical protein
MDFYEEGRRVSVARNPESEVKRIDYCDLSDSNANFLKVQRPGMKSAVSPLHRSFGAGSGNAKIAPRL